MRNSKLLKSILIPTLGISAIGSIAAISTSCSCGSVNVTSVSSVSLNKSETTLDIGATETLIATVLPENATNKDVTWTSSDTNVATVDKNGKIIAVGLGNTIVTVTSVDNPSAKATCEVNVDSSSYVAINANEDSTLTFRHDYFGNFPDLQYSIDGGTNWSPYSTTININQGQSLYLKGNNPNGWSSSTSVYSTLSITGDVSIYGNVMALLDNGAETAKTIPYNYCFYNLFQNSTGITSVSKNFLPAKSLVNACYQNMFYGCSSLTTAPKLPATSLANNCYQNMFYGCSSLTTAPILPATTLTENCYRAMFGFCSSLTTAPNLPATTLATECYRFMFQGCSSLTTAPEILPATNLADNCYYGMFHDCSSLTTAPAELPATSLANNCYQNMFYGCSSLTTAPAELPATTLANRCYCSMFEGCTSLTTAPDLPATSLANNCYVYMFRDCTSLTTAPAELPATTLANSCYDGMFQNCSSLTTAPELPATTLAETCYANMFKGCSSLNSIKIGYTGNFSNDYFYNWVKQVPYSGTFYYNGSDTCVNFGFPSGWTKTPF